MNLAQLTVLVVVSALDLALGIAVCVRNWNSRIHRLFALATLGLVAYMTANFMCDQTLFVSHALLLNRLTVATGLLAGVPLFAFGVSFPENNSRLSLGWRIGVGSLALLALVAAFTDAIVADVQVRPWGTNVVQGPLFPYFSVWVTIVCIAFMASFWIRYSEAEGRMRDQFKYLGLGFALLILTSLVISSLLPVLTGSNELLHLMPLTTLLFLLPTGYAVVRYRLLDVRFVVLRAAAYVLLLVLSGGLWVLLLGFASAVIQTRFAVDPRLLALITGLSIALGFQPLRAILERSTNRYFYGRTYNPDALRRRLGVTMALTLDRHRLASLLSSELCASMRLSRVSVVYRRHGLPVRADAGAGVSDADALRLIALDIGSVVAVADECPAGSLVRTTMRECGIEVIVPLVGDGEVLGTVMLGTKLSGRAYSLHDLKFLEVLASEAAIAARNAMLFESRSQRVRELTVLNRLASGLSSDTDIQVLLDGALTDVVSVTGADSGSIMLLDLDGVLRIASSIGLRDEIAAETCVPVGTGIAGWVAENREPLLLVSNIDPRFADELRRAEIGSAISAPVLRKDVLIGVLNVNRTRPDDFFSSENLNVVKSFAGQLGAAIDNARLYTDLENTFLGTITALASTVDAKDPYTFGHSEEVTRYAVATAEHLGMSNEDMETVRIGATLHDIGKIGVALEVLHKTSRLNDEEWAHVRRHPTTGADILAPLDFLNKAVPLVLFHHERFDGKGYPSGISGEAIPLGARIIAVADTFNAMTSHRPYRAALPIDVAIAEIERNFGTQFDPMVAMAFLEVLAAEQSRCALTMASAT